MKSGITVVIPTYNRASLLSKTLKSLLFQDLDKQQFEVLVIDDGSSDNTEEVVACYQNKMHISYFFQEDLGFRAGSARNRGIAHAKFDVCVFLDCGVLATSGLLAAHLRVHQQQENLTIIGALMGFQESGDCGHSEIPDFDSAEQLDQCLKSRTVADLMCDVREKRLKELNLLVSDMRSPWILFWTAHVSCKTKDLTDISGFDEWFNSWGGEDVELAIRLHKKGVKFDFLGHEKVFHCSHEKDLKSAQGSRIVNSRYIFAKHSEHYPSDEFKTLLEYEMTWEDVEGTR